jgi:DNA-binding NarL/FixJ family response regulator
MIRVVVVDDHGVVRDGLRAALGTRADIDVVGEAATGNDAVAVVIATMPDVVIMDLNLPDIDGVTATRRIIESGSAARILVLTMQADDESVVRAVRAGARGYLLKDAGRDEIEWAIRTVAGGGSVLGAAVGDQFLESISGSRRPTLAPFPQLSDRERELLELLAQGRSNADIARALFLSQKTVRNRVSAIFTKLGVDDRAQAMITARDAGFGRG